MSQLGKQVLPILNKYYQKSNQYYKEPSLSTEDQLKGMLIMANLYKLKGEK